MQRGKVVRNFDLMSLLALIVLAIFVSSANAELVLWYPFDEGAGTIAHDSTANHLDGALWNDPCVVGSVPPQWTADRHGTANKALLFGTPTGTGVNYVWRDYNSKLDLSGSFTVTAWLRIDNDSNLVSDGSMGIYGGIVDGSNYIFQVGATTDPNMYSWATTNAPWQFAITSDAYPTVGAWHHVAYTYDATAKVFKYYLDGVQKFSKSGLDPAFSHAYQTWSYLYIGYYGAGNHHLVGALDDVAIWKSEALSQTQVTAVMNGSPSSYVAGAIALWYPFDEGSGTVAHDSSGNNLNGTLVADPCFTGSTRPVWTTDRNGNTGKALLFGTPASTGRNLVMTPFNSRLDLTSSFSIIAWLRIDNDGNAVSDGTMGRYGGIIDGTNYQFQVGSSYETDQQIYSWAEGNADWQFGMGTQPPVGSWHHVAFVYNADTRIFTYYQDAKQKYQISDMNAPDSNSFHPWGGPSGIGPYLLIGYYGDGQHHLIGALDDIAVYNLALSAVQVEAAKNGNPLSYNTIVPTNCNDVNSPSSVYALGYGLAFDYNHDCYTNFKDFNVLALEWLNGQVIRYPAVSGSELLTNAAFENDFSRVPEVGDYVLNPTNWTVTPATSDANLAGVANVSDTGVVDVGLAATLQPAGGDVAGYITTPELSQIVASPSIVNAQTYYLSVMYCGWSPNRSGPPPTGAAGFNFQNQVNINFEWVNSPTTPTTSGTIKAITEYTTGGWAWRKVTATYTADATSAGKYFRVRINQSLGTSIPELWTLYIGDVSIRTSKPTDWPTTNLITNGDFEDVSNLPATFTSNATAPNQYTLRQSNNGWIAHSSPPGGTSKWPVGWLYEWVTGKSNGLQSMTWAPSPQPSQGRITIWLDGMVAIHQKVTSATIVGSQTYYLESVSTISAEAYNTNVWTYPTDPCTVVELYWLAPGKTDILSGTQGVDWDGPIAKLLAHPDHGLGANGGHWQVADTNFVTASSLTGKSFYVKAYGTDPYAYFDDIYLGLTPRPVPPPYYTCYAAKQAGAYNFDVDVNQDCKVDFKDVKLLVLQWLNCNNPADTHCTHNW